MRSLASTKTLPLRICQQVQHALVVTKQRTLQYSVRSRARGKTLRTLRTLREPLSLAVLQFDLVRQVGHHANELERPLDHFVGMGCARGNVQRIVGADFMDIVADADGGT